MFAAPELLEDMRGVWKVRNSLDRWTRQWQGLLAYYCLCGGGWTNVQDYKPVKTELAKTSNLSSCERFVHASVRLCIRFKSTLQWRVYHWYVNVNYEERLNDLSPPWKNPLLEFNDWYHERREIVANNGDRRQNHRCCNQCKFYHQLDFPSLAKPPLSTYHFEIVPAWLPRDPPEQCHHAREGGHVSSALATVTSIIWKTIKEYRAFHAFSDPCVVTGCGLLGDFKRFCLASDDRLEQLENIANLCKRFITAARKLSDKARTWVSMVKRRETWPEALLGPIKVIRWSHSTLYGISQQTDPRLWTSLETQGKPSRNTPLLHLLIRSTVWEWGHQSHGKLYLVRSVKYQI